MAELISRRQALPPHGDAQNCYISSYVDPSSSNFFFSTPSECGAQQQQQQQQPAWRRLKPVNRLPCSQIVENNQQVQRTFYAEVQVTIH
jgi:hypothetical protein